MRIRARTSVTCASATARTAGPERRRRVARRPARARPGGAGAAAIPRRVLISETASAPCSSAARATAAGEAVLGVSLTISGLPVHGRTASSSAASSPGSAPNISPVLTLGQETLSSSAVTSSRSATRLDEPPQLLVGPAHDVDDQRHGQLGQLRQVVGEEAVEALVGQPDRVQQPAGQLVQARRRVALARRERDGLGHERGEREALQQRVAERASRGDRVERAGRVDDRLGEVEEHQATSSRSAASSTGPSTHRRT